MPAEGSWQTFDDVASAESLDDHRDAMTLAR